ncbi:MAG: hypothetical protein V4611_02350 [Patescibacteria group bacterium]
MKRSLLFLGIGIGIFITSALTVFFIFTFVMPNETGDTTNTQETVQEETQSTPPITEEFTPIECINDPASGAYCVQE